MKRRARGEGTIFKEKTGLWVGEITLPNGKRRRKRAKTQGAVQEWLQTQREASRNGLLVEDDKVSFGQFIDRYFEDVVRHNVQPKTFESYESITRVHIKPALEKERLSRITPQMLQALYAKKLDSGLSKRTVHYIHTIIHKTLDQALRWGLVARNVSDLVDKPSPKRMVPTVWNVAQVNTFLNSTKNHRWYPIYVLAIYCGLREGELLGLHLEDIDLRNRTIQVKHAVQYLVGGGLVIKEPKTASGKRAVVIPGYALSVLMDHLFKTKVEKGLIFTTSNGTPISPRNLVRHF